MLEWLNKKQSHYGISSADVVVTKSIVNNRDYFNIRFLEKVMPNVSRNGYVRIAVDGTRLYFDEADFSEGWKLQVTRGTGNRYLRIAAEGKLKDAIEIGSYDLELDKYTGYYYIDIDKKHEKQKIKWENK